MFDVGFTELLAIAVVALLVFGPDKLPSAIKTTGLWVGRLKRSFNNVRSEIEREIGADEIRRQLRNEAIMDKIKNTRSQVTKSIDSVKDEVKSMSDSVKNEVESVSGSAKSEMDSLKQSFNPTSPPTDTQPDKAAGTEQVTAGQSANATGASKPDSAAQSSPADTSPQQPGNESTATRSPEPGSPNSNNTDSDDKQRT